MLRNSLAGEPLTRLFCLMNWKERFNGLTLKTSSSLEWEPWQGHLRLAPAVFPSKQKMYSIVGKGSANVGGHFGPELKYAGFGHIVISGRSDLPVYLWIQGGKAELRDAKFIWGKTTFETEEMLKKEHAPEKIRVASIGPAGENLVRGSGVVCDRAKVVGGSGIGCVMGNKKLKAVIVCGQGGFIKVARPDCFFQAVDMALKKVKGLVKNFVSRRNLILKSCRIS